MSEAVVHVNCYILHSHYFGLERGQQVRPKPETNSNKNNSLFKVYSHRKLIWLEDMLLDW